MNVLVVGGGGREHALAWKIALSSRVSQVFVAPGNAGTAGENTLPIRNIDITDTDVPALLKFAKQNAIELAVIGPESPLAVGIADTFSAAGIRVFGPSKQAAELEASKVFCKNLLRNADVPTADF